MLNGGEDFNGNGTLQRYGEPPWDGDAAAPNYIDAGAVAPFDGAADRRLEPVGDGCPAEPLRPRSAAPASVLFRRALKIINGGMVGAVNNIPAAGFTVASENPVYIQGNFNATTTDVGGRAQRGHGHHGRRDHAAVERLRGRARRCASRTT